MNQQEDNTRNVSALRSKIFRAEIGVGVLLILLAALAVGRAYAVFSSYGLPSFSSCYVGKEDLLSAHLADSSRLELEDIVFFANSDEANYLRNVEQWHLGITPTDSLSWGLLKFLQSSDPSGEDLAVARTREGLLRGFAERHQFVSYRSVIFPLIFAPVISQTGCNSDGLSLLRKATFVLRLTIPILAAILIFLVTQEHRGVKSLAVGVLIAFDEQLSHAAATFMPEVPAVAIMFLAFIFLALGLHRNAWLFCLLGGLLLGLLSLVKFDFLYVVPLSLLASAVLFCKKRIASGCIFLSLLAYILIISAYVFRNHELTGRYFVTSKDTVNLWIGNSSQAKLRGYTYGLTDDEWPRHIQDLTDTERQTLVDHGMELALRDYFTRRLLGRIFDDPADVLDGVLSKARLLFLNGGLNLFPLLGAAGYALGILINLLAWLGIVFWAARRWQFSCSPFGAVLVSAFIFSFCIVSIVFFLPRFLSHIAPLATIIAVCFVVDKGGISRARKGMPLF
jgi:hypothetical protein